MGPKVIDMTGAQVRSLLRQVAGFYSLIQDRCNQRLNGPQVIYETVFASTKTRAIPGHVARSATWSVIESAKCLKPNAEHRTLAFLHDGYQASCGCLFAALDHLKGYKPSNSI
jgi:hypothetical protein